MKKLLFILSILLFGQLNAQTIKRGSINSIGFNSPNINFSVGQYTAGNYTSGTNKITVGFQQPVRINLDTTISIIGDLSICPGDTTVIKANSSPFYTWFKNDTVFKAKDTSFINLTQNDRNDTKDVSTYGKYMIVSTRHTIRPDTFETIIEVASDTTNSPVISSDSGQVQEALME